MHIPAALSIVITDRVAGALEERRIAAVRGAQFETPVLPTVPVLQFFQLNA
jgi:hypothetical protein